MVRTLSPIEVREWEGATIGPRLVAIGGQAAGLGGDNYWSKVGRHRRSGRWAGRGQLLVLEIEAAIVGALKTEKSRRQGIVFLSPGSGANCTKR
jgi:hypothetical protein